MYLNHFVNCNTPFLTADADNVVNAIGLKQQGQSLIFDNK